MGYVKTHKDTRCHVLFQIMYEMNTVIEIEPNFGCQDKKNLSWENNMRYCKKRCGLSELAVSIMITSRVVMMKSHDKGRSDGNKATHD